MPNPVRDFSFFFSVKFSNVFSSDVDQQSDAKYTKESNFLLRTEIKWTF